MKNLLVKAWSYGDDLVSGFLQRYKSRANARHAFKNYNLRDDLYTVTRRYRGRDEDGNVITTGAVLIRKYKGTRPIFEPPTYYAGNCIDSKAADQLRKLSAMAADIKIPQSLWTAMG